MKHRLAKGKPEKERPEKTTACPTCGGSATLSREAGAWGLYVCDMAQECPEFEINYAAMTAEAKSKGE